MAVYRRHDPADNLYVLAEGAVEVVRDPTGTGPGERVAKNEAFGWLAFLTGTPHVSTAVAVSDTTVWCVPRDSFVHLLPNSPTLLQAVHRWLRSTEIFSYLAQRQGMGTEAAQVWCDAVVESLGRRGTVPPARSVERQAERFVTIAPTITRFSLFSELSEDERRLVACRLLYKRHRRGDTFFLKGDPADRLYVLDEGEVSLVDPADLVRRPELVRPHGAFGCRALLIGGRHTTAALATEDTAVWVLGAKTSSLASYPRMSYAWWPVVSYTSGTGAGTRFF
jgi:CRP-like cAMP-binding protein